MIALNRKCYSCKYMKYDYSTKDDYCERGNDDIMFDGIEHEVDCPLYEIDAKKMSYVRCG